MLKNTIINKAVIRKIALALGSLNDRFRYEDIKVDVMNTKAVGWAPANPWFAPGFAKRETVAVEDQKVQILPLPYFLASKLC